MTSIDVYFDCSSPWTYLGFENVQRLADRIRAALVWKPFLVGGVFNTVNDSVLRSREHPIPLKQAYTRKDLADWARFAGLEINFPPSIFPVNSVKAMRGCLAADERDKLVPFARAVFQAYWRDDKDIADEAVLAALAEGAGLDAAALLARISEPGIKAALRSNTDALIARGGFGTPTFFLDDDMYFGNDRLVLLEAAIVRSKDS